MSTKRAMTICLCSLVLLFAADRATAFLCLKLLGHSQNRYVSLYEGRSDAEVVVVGNSRADSHFPPHYLSEQLGHPLKNYGIGGISTEVAEVLVLDHIERNSTPKLLIVEASSLTVDPNLLGDMRIFSVYSSRMGELVRGSQPDFGAAGEVFHLFRFNTEMFFRLLIGIFREPQDRLHFTEIRPGVVAALAKSQGITLETFPRNLQALSRLAKYCSAHDVELRVVISPWIPEIRRATKNLSEWKKEIATVLNEDQKILDYSESIVEHRYFEDGNHLNAEGAFQFFRVMQGAGVYSRL